MGQCKIKTTYNAGAVMITDIEPMILNSMMFYKTVCALSLLKPDRAITPNHDEVIFLKVHFI